MMDLRALVRRRELLFIVVGGTNTVVGFLLFALFYRIGLPYLVAFPVAYVIATVWGFTLNRLIVFQVRGNLLVDFLRYCSVQIGSFVLNYGVLWLLVQFAGLSPLLAQVVAVPIVVGVTYVGHSRFSFRRAAPPSA